MYKIDIFNCTEKRWFSTQPTLRKPDKCKLSKRSCDGDNYNVYSLRIQYKKNKFSKQVN